MPLRHVARPVAIHSDTMYPMFPMRDGAVNVPVLVSMDVLDKLGCELDYLAACSKHRPLLEQLAYQKYEHQGGGAVVITLADIA